MNIVIVGGGTAGWLTALLAVKRHPNHTVTVIESSSIGIVGVGESTTGRITDVLLNQFYDLGCDINEFIIETGATLKYGIKHKGWTNNIEQHYIAPIDGSWTNTSVPDPFFNWGLSALDYSNLLTTSRCGHWIANGMSNFNIDSQSFEIPSHAMHVDAHLVGQYFKKICLRNANAKHLDRIVTKVNLNSITGNIESLNLDDGSTINGDLFFDCSGFHKILINAVGGKWVSYQKNLPLNTAMPFPLEYDEGEMPAPYTTAWAQQSGWLWSLPLMDRKGNGYVFCDAFTTPEKAHAEIEKVLGKKIDNPKIIKFDAGRQESAWIKNCVSVGLSTAFLEPLEATSIHSTIVQSQTFIFEYLKSTIEDTLNEGSRNIFNQRMRKMYDDVKDFIIIHYMGGRDDTDFWKYMKTDGIKTEFVANLLEMSNSKIPTVNDFPVYPGSAGWPLYGFVMAGLGLLNKDVASRELNMQLPVYGPLRQVTANTYYEMQDQWRKESKLCYSYNDFIKHFRDIRYKNGLSNKQH